MRLKWKEYIVRYIVLNRKFVSLERLVAEHLVSKSWIKFSFFVRNVDTMLLREENPKEEWKKETEEEHGKKKKEEKDRKEERLTYFVCTI